MSKRDQLVPTSSPRRILVAVDEDARTTAAAHEQAADLVVMPMRRRGELSHMLRDGADRHVLHHGPVPVLVVPEP